MKKVLKISLISIVICILGQLPALAGNSPDLFIGPKPGVAVVYQYSFGSELVKVVGMGTDDNGRFRILHEMAFPPKTVPHPTCAGEFLTHGYFQQFMQAEGKQLLLSDKAGDVAVAYLDLSQDQWTEHIPLLVGCSDLTPESECPPPPAGKTEVKLSILSRFKKHYLGEQREIIQVALDVRTKEFGTLGSSTLFFVSGLGMFSTKLPQNPHIEYLSSKELQALDDRFNAFMEAYRE